MSRIVSHTHDNIYFDFLIFTLQKYFFRLEKRKPPCTFRFRAGAIILSKQDKFRYFTFISHPSHCTLQHLSVTSSQIVVSNTWFNFSLISFIFTEFIIVVLILLSIRPSSSFRDIFIYVHTEFYFVYCSSKLQGK